MGREGGGGEGSYPHRQFLDPPLGKFPHFLFAHPLEILWVTAGILQEIFNVGIFIE